jgi:prepilin-type processing-associated H-X9-DG protein
LAQGSPALLAACDVGAKEYSGLPIAAFKDPSDAGLVICWADGHVSKSPPPAPDGAVLPDFNRVV